MAQPPNTTDTFVREVDENLRRDRAQDFLRNNAKWLIAGVILFFIVAAALIYWRHHRREQAEKQVEQLAQIYRDLGSGNNASPNSIKQLDELSDSNSKAVRASAKFTRAAVAIQQNDVKLATQTYRELASDSSLPDAYRNAALIRQTMLEFDSMKPEEVIARLEPLAKAGNPWFGSAAELTAMAMLKQGKKAQAGQLFAAIAKDESAPSTARGRAVQIASTLGVDASVSTQNQPSVGQQ